MPLADRLAAELEALFKLTAYAGDDDLVFAHPHVGKPLERRRLLKRFKANVKATGIRRFIAVETNDKGEEVERVTIGSTTCVTRSALAWQRRERRCAHSRSGWGAEISPRQIYSDYAPGAHESDLVNAALSPPAPVINSVIKLSGTGPNSDVQERLERTV